MVRIPVVTLGSTIASVLQFIVVVGILVPALATHTQTGAGIVPGNYLQHLNGTIGYLNQSFITPTGANSLQQQMSGVISASANAINPGILQSLGGLAFIPAAFGAFMNSMWNLPGVVINLFSSIFTNTGAVILPFSMFLISAAFLSYFTMIFAFKLLTPITKVEIEDV